MDAGNMASIHGKPNPFEVVAANFDRCASVCWQPKCSRDRL